MSGFLTPVDINECESNNGGCLQICNNVIGSFACSCSLGFSLSADGRTCLGKVISFMHKTMLFSFGRVRDWKLYKDSVAVNPH